MLVVLRVVTANHGVSLHTFCSALWNIDVLCTQTKLYSKLTVTNASLFLFIHWKDYPFLFTQSSCLRHRPNYLQILVRYDGGVYKFPFHSV
jgi:hypothetical protein